MSVELGEVHVAKAGTDDPDLLTGPHERVLRHGRLHVPVRELASAGPAHGHRIRVAEDRPGCDSVDARPVPDGDVDAEMEVAAEARIVEGAADHVLLVERLDGPPVRTCEGRRT